MKKLTTYSAAVLVAIITSGCVPPPIKMQSAFDLQAHQSYAQAGTGSVKGQGFINQMGGGVVTCAGQDVVLMPATPFFKELMGIAAKNRQPEVNEAQKAEYRKVSKKTQCDAQGNFKFTGVPAGDWMLATGVHWMAGQYNPQGSELLQAFKLTDGETKEVLLTGRDAIN